MNYGKIRNTTYLEENVVDFTIFEGCFSSPKMSMSDIDGICERHGKFLVLEKKSNGAQLTTGQRITLEALHKTNEKFTIVIVYGTEFAPRKIEVWEAHTKQKFFIALPNMSSATLHAIVKHWFACADTKTKTDFSTLITQMEDAFQTK